MQLMGCRSTSGWRPARRNKKTGTSDQGFKNRNTFRISTSWADSRPFWEKVKNPVILPQNIGGHKFALVVEPVLADFKYYVTVDDLLQIVAEVPKREREDITAFVFRQPKRKERIFSNTWGRLAYFAEFGEYGGPSVIIESQPEKTEFKTTKHVTPDHQKELDKLEEEGHKITRGRNCNIIKSPPEAKRNTQLYRTILHEIGHYVQYMQDVNMPSDYGDGENWQGLHDEYFARPSLDKEYFAEKYAEEIRERLMFAGIVPFSPIVLDEERHPGIDQKWFFSFD